MDFSVDCNGITSTFAVASLKGKDETSATLSERLITGVLPISPVRLLELHPNNKGINNKNIFMIC